LLRILSCLIAVAMAAGPVGAQTTSDWTGAAGTSGSGNYFTAGNWDNNVPNGSSAVANVTTVNGGTPYTVSLTAPPP
jgi:hypothetical protein